MSTNTQSQTKVSSNINVPNYSVRTTAGRLAQDPRIQTYPKGNTAIKFTIASNITDEIALFEDVSVEFDYLKRTITNLKKGSPVIVRGKLCAYTTTDKKTDLPVTKFYIKAEQIDILDKSDLNRTNTNNKTDNTLMTEVIRYETENSESKEYPFNILS